jgi:hypothetical protein
LGKFNAQGLDKHLVDTQLRVRKPNVAVDGQDSDDDEAQYVKVCLLFICNNIHICADCHLQ